MARRFNLACVERYKLITNEPYEKTKYWGWYHETNYHQVAARKNISGNSNGKMKLTDGIGRRGEWGVCPIRAVR